MKNITWHCKAFSVHSNNELYKILQLRASVFVVEQNCPYQDCDDKDQISYHLTAWNNDKAVAYARLIPPGISYPTPSIGRVATDSSVRRSGIGRELMKRAMEKVEELFGRQQVTIGAQLYLKKFYESFGFTQIGDVYLEDDIEHIKMES
ncbi:GNAT family N-acetyltransferase [soil metagenome]